MISGGGTLDLNGNTETLANSIGNGGPGGLTVISATGSGVLNLTAANDHKGVTTVGPGTKLNVKNNSGSGTGSGAVVVNGTLSGNGTIAGAVTVGAGGQTFPSGGGTAATMTMGSNLTYTAGAANPTNAVFVLSANGTGQAGAPTMK